MTHKPGRAARSRAENLFPPAALVSRDHPALRREAEPVDAADEEVIDVACRMVGTLLKARHALAVAAPQIGRPWQLVAYRQQPFGPQGIMVVANPLIIPRGDDTIEAAEGCLTYPNRLFMVTRANKVGIQATRIRLGQEPDIITWQEEEPARARCWQHEHDHLRGVLIPDLWPEIPISRTVERPRRKDLPLAQRQPLEGSGRAPGKRRKRR